MHFFGSQPEIFLLNLQPCAFHYLWNVSNIDTKLSGVYIILNKNLIIFKSNFIHFLTCFGKASGIILLSDTVARRKAVEEVQMHKLYRILWSLAILMIIVTIAIFSFGFILIAAAVVSLLGIYRYYFMKKQPKEFMTRPYTNVEVIDLQAEVIRETIVARKPDEYH